VILEFPDPADRSIVYTGNTVGGLFLEDDEEIRRYILIFEDLKSWGLVGVG
jgi:hypothetical protein